MKKKTAQKLSIRVFKNEVNKRYFRQNLTLRLFFSLNPSQESSELKEKQQNIQREYMRYFCFGIIFCTNDLHSKREGTTGL